MSADPTHPSFPSPCIAEALCEIRFSAFKQPGGPHAGEFFKQIQPDFPEVEPIAEVGVQVQMDKEGLGHRLLAPRQRLRFKHREKPLYLQLGSDLLVVNLLATYPGWTQMKAEVLDAWSKAYRVHGQGTAIHGLTLRYINRIERENLAEQTSAWLRPTDVIPAAALRSDPGFLLRLEVQREGRTAVTLGDEPTPAGSGSLVLDIERTMNLLMASFTPEPDLESLAMTLDHLHNDIWRIFDDARTEKLTALLERRPE